MKEGGCHGSCRASRQGHEMKDVLIRQFTCGPEEPPGAIKSKEKERALQEGDQPGLSLNSQGARAARTTEHWSGPGPFVTLRDSAIGGVSYLDSEIKASSWRQWIFKKQKATSTMSSSNSSSTSMVLKMLRLVNGRVGHHPSRQRSRHPGTILVERPLFIHGHEDLEFCFDSGMACTRTRRSWPTISMTILLVELQFKEVAGCLKARGARWKLHGERGLPEQEFPKRVVAGMQERVPSVASMAARGRVVGHGRLKWGTTSGQSKRGRGAGYRQERAAGLHHQEDGAGRDVRGSDSKEKAAKGLGHEGGWLSWVVQSRQGHEMKIVLIRGHQHQGEGEVTPRGESAPSESEFTRGKSCLNDRALAADPGPSVTLRDSAIGRVSCWDSEIKASSWRQSVFKKQKATSTMSYSNSSSTSMVDIYGFMLF
ncbi:hypothetical protein GOP47_0017818 [Adiantum capillus-veneris]|uniref:Uncharacterized protein n=1 Tax=Adiantum capillus-veneris TaxID=13818 RepID=A0A9D4UGC3_ADICA|nr:hypothetical protein GOP47_0017818 [Adiantum capillus-veneris]